MNETPVLLELHSEYHMFNCAFFVTQINIYYLTQRVVDDGRLIEVLNVRFVSSNEIWSQKLSVIHV
jgi:hypothetical protein